VRRRLAFASLRRRRARSLLAILGVAVSGALLLDMVMLAGGMRDSFRNLLLVRGFQLRIAPKGTLPFDTQATIGQASAIIATLRTNPDIVTVSPILGLKLHVPSRNVTTGVRRRSHRRQSGVLGCDARASGRYPHRRRRV
jgi:putative ABC transport system permease protein